LRIRPILMTSFAFILGVVPLLLGNGAGAEMRRTLGVAVFSGMLGVTLFGIFLTPVFFYVIEWFAETPLFSCARVHRFGQVLRFTLGAVTLGVLWLPAALARALRRQAPTAAKLPKLHGKAADGRPAPHGQFHVPPGADKEKPAAPYARAAANGNANDHNGDA